MQFCFAGSPRGEGRGRIAEVGCPDPKGWCGLSGPREKAREDARNRPKARPSSHQLRPRFPKSAKETRNSPSPPPLGERRSAIGPRGCHSRAPTLEWAPGRRQSPHTPEGWGRPAACGRRLPGPLARQHTQGSSKAVSSKSRPSCPPRPAAPCRRAAAYLAADSIQRRASGLSRPLNFRERARARRLAGDWPLGRGRRHGAAARAATSPFPPLSSRGRRRSNAWELVRGVVIVKPSRLIGSLPALPGRGLNFPHAQLVRRRLGASAEARRMRRRESAL